jgi:hypothetical protein
LNEDGVEVEQRMAEQEKQLRETFFGPEARQVMHIWDSEAQKYLDPTAEPENEQTWKDLLKDFNEWKLDDDNQREIPRTDRGFDR